MKHNHYDIIFSKTQVRYIHFYFFTNQVRRNNRRNCDWLGPRSASDWLLFRRDLSTYVPKASHELSTDHRRTSRRAPWGALWGSPRGTPLIHVINTWYTMSDRCLWQLKLPPEYVINNFGNFWSCWWDFLSFIGMQFQYTKTKTERFITDAHILSSQYSKVKNRLTLHYMNCKTIFQKFWLFVFCSGFWSVFVWNPTVFQPHMSSRNSSVLAK